MAVINLRNVSLSFGGPLLLDQINLLIEQGERVCLLGRNGAGKSSLMKIINGDLAPDSGWIERSQNIKAARLTQEVPPDADGTVYEIIARGLEHIGNYLTEYHKISHQLSTKHQPQLLNKLDELHQKIESVNGWQIQQQIDTVISRMQLDDDSDFKTLSGGLKRRVLLAKALVGQPDILLLDEPTNHLDIDAIQWMEDFLLKFDGTLIFVTHDRSFLRRLATRIVELDRGNLYDWSCDYDTFLQRKEALLSTEEKENRLFDKKLAQEEIWIRKGIKARRTRNEGRVRALKKMREERLQRREQTGNVTISVQEANKSGRLVIEAKNIHFAYGNRTIVNDFSTSIMRGDKIGIAGPNGSGKTTLIQLLLKNLNPSSGSVRLGTNLEIIYFDQLRDKLDDTKTVADNVGDGNDKVTVNGKTRHIISYLKDFLFTPDRSLSPVSVLSGGERNRLLLAKLFTQPSNVIVMDEPTNDLDIETLELLEEVLLNYQGTLLLVSHDRTFLNNLVTSTIVLGGDGDIDEYIGGYDDWLIQKIENGKEAEKVVNKIDTQPEKKNHKEKPRKITFRETKELEALPAAIESLENEKTNIYESMSQPSFYQKSGDEIIRINERLETIENELNEYYLRWEELESLSEQS